MLQLFKAEEGQALINHPATEPSDSKGEEDTSTIPIGSSDAPESKPSKVFITVT